MINADLSWYAVYTKSRHEKKVLDKLTAKGVESYLPLVSRMSQWKDRIKRVEEPLLKGYVFVHINMKMKLDVLQTQGIVYFVKIGNEIPEIPQWQIDALKAFVENYGENVFIEDYRKFKVGEKVRVTVGPLKGLMGRIVAGGKKIRFAVGIDSIKSSFSVEIEPTYLEKIDAPEPEDKKIKKYRVR